MCLPKIDKKWSKLLKDSLGILLETWRSPFSWTFIPIGVLWWFLILFQINKNPAEMIKFYANLSLTLFGFTLIGTIFDKREHNPVITQMLLASVYFLIASVIFLFTFALIGTGAYNTTPVPIWMVLIFWFGLLIFIAGVIGLLWILLKLFWERPTIL